MIIDYLLAAFLFCYLVQIFLFLLAIRHFRDECYQSIRPFVSIVIAARDEEDNLPACIESTLNQTYHQADYEVIVVNDHSSDGTEAVCQRYAQRHSNFRYLNATESATLRGKSNALDQGIFIARGDVILITDADCTVPPTWIEGTAKRFGPTVGIVGGMTLQKAENWFEGMQSLDWIYLLGLASATISMRIPLSTIGNNLSFRKSAYNQVGGYRDIPFSVTEDFVLFQAVVRSKKWDYLCPVDPEVLVTSQPCQTWRELLRQKQRWGKGGLDMKLSGLMVMVIGFGLNVLLLLSLWATSIIILCVAAMLKLCGDYAFLHTILKRQRRLGLLKYFIPFEAYFFLYVLLLPFIVFFGGPVIWKGRSY